MEQNKPEQTETTNTKSLTKTMSDVDIIFVNAAKKEFEEFITNNQEKLVEDDPDYKDIELDDECY